MSNLNATPSANRLHIGIFGRRNAGKSSIINALTGQDLAIVSDIQGTTTDPVLKAMELLPLGPVVLIDTPGLDDEGALGALRVKKAFQMLNKTDIAVLVVDAGVGLTEKDREILRKIQEKEIPYVIAYNKCDRTPLSPAAEENVIHVSAATGKNIHQLKELIARCAATENIDKKIVGDLLSPGDFVVLVVPIDSAAPKGRLILPQQQTIRDILDSGAVAVTVRDTELEDTLRRLDRQPALVITDSQVFEQAAAVTPPDIPLTSFSILFARYKGDLKILTEGAAVLDELKENDTVLISEGCTHHRQCNDIGTVKLPNWIQKHTGRQLRFAFTSGTQFPDDLSPYQLVIHCGGCMLNDREMKYRLRCAKDQGIPITNYGTAIAHMKGILKRSTSIFSL
ncbi:[FeFe] hydrogenase H-cluster maturation GTPase HydF [Faecalicatena acetigenes]|uniref:[FeFe] hydrogenase H-cluster maturation GTPase HydF n=1 Tax=Faecalicatena acetigenes TaxID=2981790 RepID=A0ABT2T9N4_9FIRM|nr:MULTISPECIES: [FeFe] hydrogenase H-cluster maturation GTPase HydF [Lachnospiraceae]MCU6746983.1 [FeFe] hydrogenase H-cluster maturation GTPase HydF [Faecalicatena acetigenes]SCH57202.1 tRNA modification GTPase MnmE [uncultured Clostridium sp.]